ncbi:MAG: NAD-dependent epimerase/dehydratase family protein [Alphaproteobacteria bacterium]
MLGASGVIGQSLMPMLKEAGWPAIAMRTKDVDLTEESAAEALAAMLEPGDSIVVLSALTPDRGRDIATFMANLRMSQAICAAVAEVPPAQLIYLSSDAVYPFIEGRVDEQSCASPFDLYGTMHLAREAHFRDTVREAPLAILRCTMVLSAADTHNSYGPNRFRHAAEKDGKITLGGGGEETRDHILDRDVARLVFQVLGRRSGGLLNLATGTSASFFEVATMVANRFNPPAELETTKRNNAVTHRHFDITALRRAFPDFAFSPLDDAIMAVHGTAL